MAGFTRLKEIPATLFVRTVIRLDIMKYSATVRLLIDREERKQAACYNVGGLITYKIKTIWSIFKLYRVAQPFGI